MNWCAGVMVHVYIMGHIMRLWSALHRVIYDRKWKDVPLLKLTIEQASWKMENFRWEEDGFTEFFDAICTPQKVTAVGFSDEPDPNTKKGFLGWLLEHGNDCDEEAVFLCNTLSDPLIRSAELMTVTWFNPDKSTPNSGYMGHNVCLIGQYDNLFRYMDYGKPRDLHTNELDIAKDVVRDYTGGKGVLISWHVSRKDLVPSRGQRL